LYLPLKDNSTVAIIGGGPAGSSCAIKLLQESKNLGRKLRVVIFEGKDYDIHFNQCVGVLSPPLQSILEKELGLFLPSELIKRQIYGYRLHGPGQEILLVGQDASEPTYTVRRVKFDKYLLNCARELGAEVLRTRVSYLEFIRKEGIDEVRIYSDSTYLKADVVVGAFGLDEMMLSVLEEATSKDGNYSRPNKVLKTYIAKFHTTGGFIRQKLGNIIYAYLVPVLVPNIEFGAITPKADHIIINIAGEKVSSSDMDAFLSLPEVKEHLPEFNRDEMFYYEGRFPTAPARNPFGYRYVTAGDATGWMRPFKGKGINVAIVTGIKAAETMLEFGINREAFENYANSCRELLDDYIYGSGVRLLCKYGPSLVLTHLIELAKVNPSIYEALYNSVSGQETYKNIIKSMFKPVLIRKMAQGVIKSYLQKKGGKMSEVKIRKLTTRDIDSVMKIDEKITGKPQEAYWAGKIASYLSREPDACLAAEIENKVVGFLLGDIRGWEYTIPLCGWIDIMGVDINYQGKGVGKMLVESLFEYFKSSGVETVMTVVDWNDGDLIDYFRSHGFERGEYINLVKKLK